MGGCFFLKVLIKIHPGRRAGQVGELFTAIVFMGAVPPNPDQLMGQGQAVRQIDRQNDQRRSLSQQPLQMVPDPHAQLHIRPLKGLHAEDHLGLLQQDPGIDQVVFLRSGQLIGPQGEQLRVQPAQSPGAAAYFATPQAGGGPA